MSEGLLEKMSEALPVKMSEDSPGGGHSNWGSLEVSEATHDGHHSKQVREIFCRAFFLYFDL